MSNGMTASNLAFLSKLNARLDDTWAAQLDADISSRAPASTALSNATWTDAKAGYLDMAISDVQAGLPVPSSLPVADTTTASRMDNIAGFLDDTNQAQLGSRFDWNEITALVTSTYVDLLSLTGPGVVQFAALWCSSYSDSWNVRFKVLLDGTAIITSSTAAWNGDASEVGDGFVVVGHFIWNSSGGVPYAMGLEAIPFTSTFKIQIAAVSTNTNTDFKCVYRWFPT